MSIGWLSRVAASDIDVTAYATGTDRIGRRDPGEITYLEDVAHYEYWDGTAWQPLGGGGGPGAVAPLTLTSTASSMVPLTLQGAPSQTANLLTLQNSAPATVLAVGPSGQLAVGAAGSFGNGAGPMIFLANTTSDPSTSPVGGGILFLSPGGGNALSYKNLNGSGFAVGDYGLAINSTLGYNRVDTLNAGATLTVGANAGAVTIGPPLTLTARPAFAAGDKYLTVDASGHVHVSAVGPAS